MFIKSDTYCLWKLSKDSFKGGSSSISKRTFGFIHVGDYSYVPYTVEMSHLLTNNNIVFDIVDKIPDQDLNTIKIKNNYVSVHVLDSIDYHSKIPRNLNTAVDVYFTFEGEIYGVRFQDWNTFRTLTDEQCEEKIRKYLIENSEIKHPAKPLEQ